MVSVFGPRQCPCPVDCAVLLDVDQHPVELLLQVLVLLFLNLNKKNQSELKIAKRYNKEMLLEYKNKYSDRSIEV